MSTRKKETNGDRVLVNNAALKEAELTSRLNSWLHTSSASINQPNKSNPAPTTMTSEGDTEPFDDEENFSEVSDTGGLDLIKTNQAPKANIPDRQNSSANDMLRRQFLGKHHANLHSRKQQHTQMGSTPLPTPSQQRHSRKTRNRNDSDDDDDIKGGRIQATTRTKAERQAQNPNKTSGNATAPESGQTTTAIPLESPVTTSTNGSIPGASKMTKKRKAAMYLDEMLAKRGKKRSAKAIDD